jgi:hypothetical protein
MVIGLDFDGTCVTHDFPHIGKDIGSVPVLKELVRKGHRLILWTMRSDMKSPKRNPPDGNHDIEDYLTDALNWFKINDIPLYGIQTNPGQHHWTESPKAHCDLYIDDLGLGIPLKFDIKLSKSPFVDWEKVRELLISRGIL